MLPLWPAPHADPRSPAVSEDDRGFCEGQADGDGDGRAGDGDLARVAQGPGERRPGLRTGEVRLALGATDLEPAWLLEERDDAWIAAHGPPGRGYGLVRRDADGERLWPGGLVPLVSHWTDE